MKVKHLLIVIFLISLLLPSKILATKWTIPFVVWDEHIYEITDQYVTEIKDNIGKVTKYSDMQQYPGNFSNIYEKGTKYYSIKDVSTKEAIAVQEKDDKYIKAVRDGEYTFIESDVHLPWILFVPFIFPVIILVFYFRKKVKT